MGFQAERIQAKKPTKLGEIKEDRTHAERFFRSVPSSFT